MVIRTHSLNNIVIFKKGIAVKKIILLVCALVISSQAFSQSGPNQANLQVKYMYMTGSAVYVSFNTGAMPGCYAGAGGYLNSNIVMFDQIYSMLLTMSVTGGMGTGAVLYNILPTANGNWGDCAITGLTVTPNNN